MKKLFDGKQEFVLKRVKRATRVGKAEAKILFIVCYYITTVTLVLTPFSYNQVTGEAGIQAAHRYFACQSTGIQSGRDCGDVRNVHLVVLAAVGVILIALLPAVILIFIVKCRCKKKCCKQ